MQLSGFSTVVRRFSASLLLGATLLTLGCAGLKTPPPPPSLAETDSTLATPMRPPSNQKYQWWEFQNLLDPRSRDIERNLGY